MNQTAETINPTHVGMNRDVQTTDRPAAINPTHVGMNRRMDSYLSSSGN